MRTLLIWCPDWPVIAAEIVDGVAASGPVVVLHGNRVMACSEAARADGVRRGLRRREAQSRCPQLVVVEHDPGRDARAFEPVVAAVEEVAVGVEVIRPGACALAARGPARYFGGEEIAAERIVEQVAQVCAVESQVGVADGVFAAGLAARSGRIIAPGGTREFLAGVPVEALERPELIDLLRRLGIKTLGDFAALPPSDVLTRFGFDGALAQRLAAGFDQRPLAVRKPPPDLDVSDTYDEPLERVDVAAFAGRVLAERLHDGLAAHGLACTRLGIEAVTADGQELHRVWRHDGTLTAAAIAERVRWQLDGWLTGARRGAPARPTAGLVRLRLIPDGVLVHLGLQPGLWGDAGAERERAHRALSRVQGLLGPDAVVTPVLGGGRSADDQVRLIPWGDERVPARPAADHRDPYPGPVQTPVLAYTPDPIVIPFQVPDPPETAERANLAVVPDADGEENPPSGPGEGEGAVVGPGWGAEASAAGGSVRGEDPADGPAGSADLPGGGRARATAGRGADRAVRRDAGGSADPGGNKQVIEDGAGGHLRLVRSPAPGGSDSAARPVTDLREAARTPAFPGARDKGQGEAGQQTRPEEKDEAGPEAGRQVGSGGGRGGKKGRMKKGPPLPPWPGRVPKPAPALVLPQPVGAVVLDADGRPVGVSARLELTAEPVSVLVEKAAAVEITGWAGPWPVEERWWAPDEMRRRARFQVVLEDGRALLLSLAGGHWAVEAIYD